MTAAAALPDHGSPRRRPFSDASPAQIRAALIPEEAGQFDQAWRQAMSEATRTLDLTGVQALLESWRRIAWLTAAGGPEAHRRMYRRAAMTVSGQIISDDEPLLDVKNRLGL